MEAASYVTKVYTADDLRLHLQILEKVVELVNSAFLEHTDFGNEPRFSSNEELCQALGPTGICVVLLRNDAIAKESVAIATASAGPWKGIEQELEFGLYAVASLNSQAYRQKGFASQCLRALDTALLSRNIPEQRVTIWANVIEHHNGPYWCRKGFKEVERKVAPKGMWGSKDDFTLLTMVRHIGGEVSKAES